MNESVPTNEPARLQALDGATDELFAFYKIRKGLVIPIA